MIIVNIRAEGEPAFKDLRKKVIKWLIDKRIFYVNILSSGFRIWLDLNNGLDESLKINNSSGFLL